MDWRQALLRELGDPITKANLQFLQSWQRWEGGATNNNATYNWLNTTHGPGRSINSVGVKAFPNFGTGIQSLAETLQNGRYGDILKGLAGGNPYAASPTAGLSTWVSGSPTGNLPYAAKVLGTEARRGGPGASAAPPPAPAPVPSAGVERQRIGLNPRTMALFGASQQMDPRQQTMGILGALLQGGGSPVLGAMRRPAAQSFAAPASPRQGASAGASSGVTEGGLATLALGGAQYSNLGGPDAHHARPLGNWQSDNAWDLGVPVGTPIYAVSDGVIGPRIGVQESRPNDGARVTLVGGNNQYWYGHLSNIVVKAGQRVRKGQLIGYSGASQNGAAHLHIGVMNP